MKRKMTRLAFGAKWVGPIPFEAIKFSLLMTLESMGLPQIAD
jgi:hypothetical protein